MKRFLPLFFCLFFLLILPACALSPADTPQEKAQALSALGLFHGKGNGDFALSDSATRNEGATMLIRLLGQESKAAAQFTACPFKDVPAWAQATVTWLYENNYVNGAGGGLYNGSSDITAQQFAALLLRSLGYSESAGDFTYANALSFAVSKNLLTEAQSQTYRQSFHRDGMVEMSYNALTCCKKNSNRTLEKSLTLAGVFRTKTSVPSTASPLKLTQKYSNGGKDSKYYVQEATIASPLVLDWNGDGKQEMIFSARSIFCLDAATGKQLWRVSSGQDRTGGQTDYGRSGVNHLLSDINGDGAKELITVHTNYGTGKSCVAVYTSQGYFLPGWPIETPKPARALTVSDLDGDGQQEICVGLGVGAGQEPSLYIYEPNGTLRTGWPQVCGYGVFSNSMTAVDINKDGQKELVLLYDDQFVLAFHADGTKAIATGGVYQGIPWNGLPVCEDFTFETRCAEYAKTHGGSCYGSALSDLNSLREERNVVGGTNGGIVAEDLDGNGSTELALTGMVLDGAKLMRAQYDTSTYDYCAEYFNIFLLNTDRTRYTNPAKGFDWTEMPTDIAPILTLNTTLLPYADNTPVASDVDGDGNREILYAAGDGNVHCWHLDGTQHGAWPYRVVRRSDSVLAFATKPTTADLNWDGKQEVIFASYTQTNQKTQNGSLYILDCNGKLLSQAVIPSVSGSVEANGSMAQPVAADVDGDGAYEIAVTTKYSGIIVYDISL